MQQTDRLINWLTKIQPFPDANGLHIKSSDTGVGLGWHRWFWWPGWECRICCWPKLVLRAHAKSHHHPSRAISSTSRHACLLFCILKWDWCIVRKKVNPFWVSRAPPPPCAAIIKVAYEHNSVHIALPGSSLSCTKADQGHTQTSTWNCWSSCWNDCQGNGEDN